MFVLKVLFLYCVTSSVIDSAFAIFCYQCNGTDSSTPFQCGEDLGSAGGSIDLKPLPCDQVHEARYCIKHVGRYEVSAILCYQCDASKTIECSDLLIGQPGGNVTSSSCTHVDGAKYCVKSTAVYGGIGAKRYCSSKDLGNYCNYVQQPGDQLNYRSCIFTCDTDGCNGSRSNNPGHVVLCVGAILAMAWKIM